MSEKMTPRQWLENYWYHYKSVTLVVGFLAIVLIVCLVQLFTKDDPDVVVTYAGYDLVGGSDIFDIDQTVKELIDDENGDGVKKMAFISLQLASSDLYGDPQGLDASKHTETMKRFQIEVAVGDTMIYFLDPYLYKILYDNGQVVPFSDSLGYVPAGAYDDCAISIGQLGLAQAPGFNAFPDTTLICLRNLPNRETYEAHRKLFQKMIEYDPKNQ